MMLLNNTFFLDHAPIFRMGFFIGILFVMSLWEVLSPRRARHFPRTARWPHNFLIVLIDSVAVKLLLPVSAAGVALIAKAEHWGLLNNYPLSPVLTLIVSLLALDLIIYFQHRLFHYIPWLWRLHRMHHTDLDYDVTTGIRFHPIEILISMLIKILAVIALGIPAYAVLIFEILLNATSLFNHGNVNLPLGLDAVLRTIVVTPDMHRVHHSAVPEETNSNFGFNLPWWDRLFKTYRAQPKLGHKKMKIGLNYFRNPHELNILQLLTQPFRKEK